MTLREQIIALDDFQCRNPKCLSVGDSFTRNILSVHHIKYKSHQGADTPENMITLCRRCDFAVHMGHGKGVGRVAGRQYMLKILDALEEAPDYRWSEVHEELRKRYGAVA